MTVNDPAHLDRLGRLVAPVPLLDLASSLCGWLQYAHDEAARLQPMRASGPRGGWRNNTSFGTDRYQCLLGTAGSLSADLPDLVVDSAFQSILLKLGESAIYQMQSAAGPRGSLSDASDLRRELLSPGSDLSLISRRDMWLSGRQLVFLVWSGTEEHGLTGAWAGQGELVDNHIDWGWLVSLLDIAEQVPQPRQEALDPTIFDVPQPELPIKPRAGRQSG